MNRSSLQQLSTVRSKEAEALLAAGFFSGSYYLAGYAIECALKACIAKGTQLHDFPDKDRVSKSYTHNLNTLLGLAQLDNQLALESQTNLTLGLSWRTAIRWNEASRYEIKTQSDAEEMIQSVIAQGGLIPWIAQYW